MPDTASVEPRGSSREATMRTYTDDEDARVHLTRHPDLVLIQQTEKGRGVFATAHIPARTVVDVSPVLILSAAENTEHIRHTKLWYYTYNWKAASSQADGRSAQSSEQPKWQIETQALPLGLGSLFNHASSRSLKHNIGFIRDFVRSTLSYITLRDIEPGEELCICYGEDRRLGFKDVDADSEAYVAADSEANGNECSSESFVENVDTDIFAGAT